MNLLLVQASKKFDGRHYFNLGSMYADGMRYYSITSELLNSFFVLTLALEDIKQNDFQRDVFLSFYRNGAKFKRY